MPKIKFGRTHNTIEANSTETVFHQILDAGIPVASSCGGFGICGKCRVKVVEGAQNFSPMDEQEKKSLQDNGGNLQTERLCCQTTINADILIDTDYW